VNGKPVGQLSRDAIFEVHEPNHERQELPA
jgi:hypothetical protein